jgi:hypothetical protein
MRLNTFTAMKEILILGWSSSYGIQSTSGKKEFLSQDLLQIH